MTEEVVSTAPVGEAAQPSPAPEAPAGGLGGEDALDSALEAIWDRDNASAKPRDARGKFARVPGETAAEPSETNSDQQPQSEEGEPLTAAIARPQAWSADKDGLWAALPPEAQTYVAQRESEATQTISRMGGELAAYRPLGELLTQSRDTFDRRGISFQDGLAVLLEAQRRLDTDPVGGLVAIAETVGIDLPGMIAQLQAQAQQGNGQAPQVDPVVSGLNQRLTGLERQLTAQQQRAQSEAQAQDAALQRQTVEEVGTWSKDKPFYEEARPMMADLLAAGRAANLDDAYDMAVHALPATRQKLADQQAAQRKATEQKENAQHVSQAKRAATVNVGGTRRAVATPSGRWDDDKNLESLYDRAQAG